MSHPLMDIACALAVVMAVGAGTALVLPQVKNEPPAQTIKLDIATPPAVRVEPLNVKSDAERIDELQRRLSAISTEHRQLATDLRAAVEARAVRKDRGSKAR